jgi:hypothetical protein
MSDNLGDREFFDAHPHKDIRRRPVIPGELPRSLADSNIHEVEVRRVEPGILLLGFIDTDGGWSAMLPVFDGDLFLTSQGRQKIAEWLSVIGRELPR